MKINSILLFFIFLCTVNSSFSQNKRDFGMYTYTNFEAGYSYSFAEPNHRNFHLLSVGLNKMVFGGRHGGGYSYGVGSDIGLNTRNFTIAPKINGFLYFQFFVIGSELAMYTDFKETTLRYIPIFGIGGEKAKLTINPQVILTNKSFEPIDRGAIQLTVNFSLEKRPKKYKNGL
ncbi:hypothetical protein [Kordia sp.]|uniref:hypothetical protein n=1 Tax=Kordia sp. TaxID=1965332 RepID=UPI003D6C3A36